jgi:hypothetical protein
MNARMRYWLTLYQYAAGICDTSTGLLLISFPGFTLSMIRFNLAGEAIAFVRFVAVFVLCVGITYLWLPARWPLSEHSAPVWLTQWKITALMRAMVALFLLWQVTSHRMEFRWIGVGVFDGVLAAIQIIGLEQEWIERAV